MFLLRTPDKIFLKLAIDNGNAVKYQREGHEVVYRNTQCALRKTAHYFLGYIEVSVDILHIVVIVESLHQ